MSSKPSKPKLPTQFQVGDETITIEIAPDTRLQKTASWLLKGQTLRIRVPRSLSASDLQNVVEGIIRRVTRQRKRAQKQLDIDLMERAEQLNTLYFKGELTWHTIRWVANMKHRLGSCTTGGATDGDIRISEKIRPYPAYVVDYILAHEICHRKHPDHSEAFWAYLARYPHVERARGFLEGIAYAEGRGGDDLLD